MNDFFLKLIAEGKINCLKNLSKIKRGIEKENLRVDETGQLAKTPHPRGLGSSLLHPLITTDYGEALLEFMTPPVEEVSILFSELENLHLFTYQILQQEYLWVASMPPPLPAESEIQIAEYGDSKLGKLKTIYRRGLGHRYGKLMQTISGIHYNFSVDSEFWQILHQQVHPDLSLQDFISESYLALMRNGMRLSFVLPFLFGASPACAASFYPGEHQILKKMGEDTLIGPYATSLRLSDLGYQNTSETRCDISYNSFPEFLKTMKSAVHTRDPGFAKIGLQEQGDYLQLSENILQIEDEHYAILRPKRSTRAEERMLKALENQGIEYLELRALDLNPFLPLGIEQNTVYFLDVFLITCLLLDSPPLLSAELQQIQRNQRQVVLEGRKPNLKITLESAGEIQLTDCLNQLFDIMDPVAELLDKQHNTEYFRDSVRTARHLTEHTSALPSAKILYVMENSQESYLEFGLKQSKFHALGFKNSPLSSQVFLKYVTLSKDSLEAQTALEKAQTEDFATFLNRYLSDF